ncbi:hypothetical protein F4808DRAFT_464419 [Astrocystis sublimbata]|nr:hypothetical protein F4808DRAFT_464419 [Astrocystis sublimbata]
MARVVEEGLTQLTEALNLTHTAAQGLPHLVPASLKAIAAVAGRKSTTGPKRTVTMVTIGETIGVMADPPTAVTLIPMTRAEGKPRLLVIPTPIQASDVMAPHHPQTQGPLFRHVREIVHFLRPPGSGSGAAVHFPLLVPSDPSVIAIAIATAIVAQNEMNSSSMATPRNVAIRKPTAHSHLLTNAPFRHTTSPPTADIPNELIIRKIIDPVAGVDHNLERLI